MGSNPNLEIFLRLTDDQQTQALAYVAAQRPGVNGRERFSENGDGSGAVNPWVGQVRTLKEAYQERPPLRYIVEKMIPEGSLSMAFGAPGSYKSFILADMAVCVATGERWLTLPDGSGGRATSPCPVLWIDCDNGTRRTDARFDALAKARKSPHDAPLYYLSMPDPALNLADVAGVRILSDTIAHFGAGLVIIDNLGLITGDVEENSSGMADVMGNLRKIAEASGAAVIVLHHQRKTTDKDQQLNIVRGHSSIAASLDLALWITRDAEDKQNATIIPVKERDSQVPVTGAVFSFENKDGRDDELAAARFWGVKLIDTKSNVAIHKAIMTVLYDAQNALTMTDLMAGVKGEGITVGRDKVTSIIESMILRKELNERRGEKNARLISVA